MRLFLYGTLLDPSILARRSGDASLPDRLAPASLAGFRRVQAAGLPYPTLRRAGRTTVPGAVLDVGATALRRLDAYEGPAYRKRRVTVRAGTRRVAATAWFAYAALGRAWREA